jgi:hypothetical protein
MISAEDFINLTKKVLSGDPKANQIIDRMVNEIVSKLNELEYQRGQEDNDDDGDDDGLGDINIDDLFK